MLKFFRYNGHASPLDYLPLYGEPYAMSELSGLSSLNSQLDYLVCNPDPFWVRIKLDKEGDILVPLPDFLHGIHPGVERFNPNETYNRMLSRLRGIGKSYSNGDFQHYVLAVEPVPLYSNNNHKS